VPAILKYMDNIADLYAHAGSVLMTAIASWLFFDLSLTVYFLLGMCASVCSSMLYYADRVFTKPAPVATSSTVLSVEMSGVRARTPLLSPK
jgi:hypothetical protein